MQVAPTSFGIAMVAAFIGGAAMALLLFGPKDLKVSPEIIRVPAPQYVEGKLKHDTTTNTDYRVDTLRIHDTTRAESAHYAVDPRVPAPNVGFNIGSLASLAFPLIAKALQDSTQQEGHLLAGFKAAFHPITYKFNIAALTSIDIGHVTAFAEFGYLSGFYLAIGIIVYLWKLL